MKRRASNGIVPDCVHADKGGSMTGKPVVELLVDLEHHPLAVAVTSVQRQALQ